MAKAISEIRTALNSRIPEQYMKTRDGNGGKTFHYINGDYINYKLNDVFGVENVDKEFVSISHEHTREFSKEFLRNGPYNAEARKYTEPKKVVEPAVEFTYMAVIRLTIRVKDAEGNVVTFKREGVGTGGALAANNEFAAQHHARQTAIKAAETDATKRAAKQIGSALGLAIDLDGKQQYASTDEADAPPADDPLNPAEENDTRETVSANENLEKAKEAAAAAQPANPRAAVPLEIQKRPAGQNNQIAAEQKPAERSQVVQNATQTTTQAPTPSSTVGQVQPAAANQSAGSQPKNDRPTNEGAAVAPPPSNELLRAKISSINVDQNTLCKLEKVGWSQLFRNLFDIVNDTTDPGDFIRLCEITGYYIDIIGKRQPQTDPQFASNITRHVIQEFAKKRTALKLENLNFEDAMSRGSKSDSTGFTPPY